MEGAGRRLGLHPRDFPQALVVADIGGMARAAPLVAAVGFGVSGLLDDLWDLPHSPG